METPDQFTASLLRAAVQAPVAARAVVKKGANNIKTEGRKNVLQSAPVHQAHAHLAITYDEPSVSAFRVESEIGYDKEIRGGALGNLLEFGGGGDHSPPHLDLSRAADSEEPRFEDALRTMAMKLL